jgi:tetraacyldisaccharide 4'-kinase
MLAVTKILNDINPDFILLDDGFQDKSLFKDKNILMVNGERGFGNKLCLPAGPLRELIKPALKRAQFLIIVGNDKTKIKSMYNDIEIDTLTASIEPLYIDKNKKYLAFSGIGNNQSFFDTLINSNCNVPKTFEFADHHFYTEGELNNLKKIASENNLSLITTEKDFVRIPKEKRKGIECLKVEIKLPNIDEFMHKLVN